MKKVFSVLLLLALLSVSLLPIALAEENAAGIYSDASAVTEETNAPDPLNLPEETQEEAPAASETPVQENEPLPKTTFGFFPDRLADSLQYMGKGMGGIFVVTGVIIVVLVILEKAGSRKKDNEE